MKLALWEFICGPKPSNPSGSEMPWKEIVPIPETKPAIVTVPADANPADDAEAINADPVTVPSVSNATGTIADSLPTPWAAAAWAKDTRAVELPGAKPPHVTEAGNETAARADTDAVAESVSDPRNPMTDWH